MLWVVVYYNPVLPLHLTVALWWQIDGSVPGRDHCTAHVLGKLEVSHMRSHISTKAGKWHLE